MRIPTVGPSDHTPAVLRVLVPPSDRIQDVPVVEALLVHTQVHQVRTAARVGLEGQTVGPLAREDRGGRKEGREGRVGRTAGRPAVLADRVGRKVVAQGDLGGQEDHASQAYFHPVEAFQDAEAAFLLEDQVLDAAGPALGDLEDQACHLCEGDQDEGAEDQTPLTPCVAVAHLQLE